MMIILEDRKRQEVVYSVVLCDVDVLMVITGYLSDQVIKEGSSSVIMKYTDDYPCPSRSCELLYCKL